MSIGRFFAYLSGTLLFLCGLLYLLSNTSKLGNHMEIAYYAVPAFTVLCLIVFFATKLLDNGKRNQEMLNLVIMNVMLKFLISVGIVVMYYKFKKPDDGIFVVVFIIIYVVFTIFETFFMSVQAKPSNRR